MSVNAVAEGGVKDCHENDVLMPKNRGNSVKRGVIPSHGEIHGAIYLQLRDLVYSHGWAKDTPKRRVSSKLWRRNIILVTKAFDDGTALGKVARLGELKTRRHGAIANRARQIEYETEFLKNMCCPLDIRMLL